MPRPVQLIRGPDGSEETLLGVICAIWHRTVSHGTVSCGFVQTHTDGSHMDICMPYVQHSDTMYTLYDATRHVYVI